MSLKRFGVFFSLVLAITLVDFLYLGKPVIGIDDANIFFTYARNLVHGQGFVFNEGGEKVEGFTSLLWVLICGAAWSISSHPELLLMFFLLVLTSISVTMVYDEIKKDVDAISQSLYKKYFFWLYCAFIICIGPSFIAWSVLSLMENGLWNFIFISICLFMLKAYRLDEISMRKKIAMLVAGILMMLTRPEGLAWSVFFSVLLAWMNWRKKKSLGFPFLFLMVMGIVAASLTYFRLQYFGYPFPNTYYAKVSSNHWYNIKSGAGYAIRFITAYHPLITLLLVVLTIVTLTNRRNLISFLRRCTYVQPDDFVLHRIFIVTAIVAVGILLPFTTGGDHFGGFRFYQSILLLFAWGMPALHWLYQQSMMKKIQKSIISMGIAIVLYFLLVSAGTLYSVKSTPKTQLNYEFFLAGDGRRTANELNELWPSYKPSVGVVAAGGFALKYNGPTIDLMGLNNTLMGHSQGDRTGMKNHAAFNKDVFYQLHPDILLPRTLASEKDAILVYADFLNFYNFENQAMKHIFNDQEFQQAYQPVMVVKKTTNKPFFVFASNEFMNRMMADSNYKVVKVVL